jgi:hypothetical protein
MLNAFCRVAPSVLFNFLAIFEAGVFRFAIVFSSRTSPDVQARRFFVLLAIEPPFQKQADLYPLRQQKKSRNTEWRKYLFPSSHTLMLIDLLVSS